MSKPLNAEALDQVFREARTHNAWNDRKIDLASYTFAGARLQQVEVSVDSSVHVRARFGS